MIVIPAIALGILGGWWFSAFVLIVVCLAAYEIAQLMRASGLHPNLLVTLAAAILAFCAIRLPGLGFPLAFLLSVLMLASLTWQMRHREGMPIADWAVGLAGGAYVGWTGGYLAAVRELGNGLDGLWWLAFAVFLTWLADSGAYVAGSRFGKHRLAPKLSPKKTWEGYIGGVIAAALGGGVLGLLSPIGPADGIAVGILVGLLGTLGDLAESMFKRQANAKDSGNLIPGHGGVFDRIDSLLWAGVVVFYYATLIAPLI